MAEEEKGERGSRPPEGDLIAAGEGTWEDFRVEAGEILEFSLRLEGEEGEPARCALLVNEVKTEDGETIYYGRFIGSTDVQKNREFGKSINVKNQGVKKGTPTGTATKGGSYAAHFTLARWWSLKNFPTTYLKPWGQLVLDEALGLVGPGAKDTPPKRTKPRRRAPPKGPEDKGLRGGPGERTEPLGGERSRKKRPSGGTRRDGRGDAARGDGARDALRAKLKGLKQRLLGNRREDQEAIIEVEESEDGGSESGPSDSAADRKTRKVELGTGSKLNPYESRLAIGDWSLPEDPRESTMRITWPVKKEKLKKKRITDSRSKRRRSSLLAVAEQREEENRKRRSSSKKAKKKSRTPGAKALVRLLSGKRMRTKDKDGGSSPSGSGSTEDGGSEEEESSSESEVTAPLKKRSLKHPGSILRLLISHATEALDQSATLEMDKESAVTGGIKMVTYFNLLVRPNFNQGSRDLKEMHLLAVCLDQLRSGQLKQLADSLSARFLALHCAAVEGSWAAAKHLELHPLEAVQSAPTEVLLSARKHAKLIQKSQGSGDGHSWSKGGGSWNSWKGGDWNEDHRRKGKGGKGKGGKKGKGKGDGWKSNDWNNWNDRNRDWWKDQKDTKDNKGEKEKESKKA